MDGEDNGQFDKNMNLKFIRLYFWFVQVYIVIDF